MLEKLLNDLYKTHQYISLLHQSLKGTHVVAENILNKLECRIGNNLVKNDLLLVARGSLQLLLDKPRPMLFTAELHDVAKNILTFRREKRKVVTKGESLPSTPTSATCSRETRQAAHFSKSGQESLRH